MRIRFEDSLGNDGEVTDELEVDYDGPWADPVEECVRRVEETVRTDGSVDEAEVFSRLVVELPEHAPVRKVECRED